MTALGAGLVSALAPLGWPAGAAADGWTWPVDGEVVSAFDYGGDSPYAGGRHRGIDIAAAPGTPVVAAAGGTVRFAGTAGSSGLTVSVRTADGRHDVSYLHLSAAAVHAGQTVAAGERIGASGTSGSPSSDGPHLHLGVRRAGTSHGYRDPLALLPPLPRAPNGPRGVPVAAPAPVRIAPPPVPARVGPRAAHAPAPRFAPAPVAAASPPARGAIGVGPAVAIACVPLAAALLASSIGLSCRTTSRRRSTTSTASRTSATSTPRSPPTCSPATCASATTTSSS